MQDILINVLDFTSGLCWSIVYAAATLLGVKRKNWLIPRLAIFQNLAWEFWIIVNRVIHEVPFDMLYAIQLLWLLLDLGVLATWLLYDKSIRLKPVKNLSFFGIIFSAMYFLTFHLGQWGLIALVINLIMSVAFVLRLRKDAGSWTSPLIAFMKMIGTLAATILHGIVYWEPLFLWIGGLCFIVDAYYFMMIPGKKVKRR